MERQLQDRIPIMADIQNITKQPGISIGVIYKGHEVFNKSLGVMDIANGRRPDGDTLYCIASLSKAFMAASLDLLAQEDKISWDNTISSIIPEYKHVDKPELFSTMTLRDICSHRTGLLSLDEITQGLDGRILLPKKDVVSVCNAMPIKHDLRANFLYNNALYELAGYIVEHVSSYSNWGDFQRDRIFKPLRMNRTTAFRSVHETDKNIAIPYMILTNGTPSKIAPTELSADSMNGGSGAIRSSVNDLLKWCRCILQSHHGPAHGNLVRQASPIFDRSTIANPHSAKEGDYCFGWCQHQTPAKLGLISPNRTLESPTLGLNSPSILVYGHQGDVPGFTCSLYIIPEDDSALVILSNGTGLSDATDWIAQDLIQTMYGLQPTVDYVDVASRAAVQYLSHFDRDFKEPLKEHQHSEGPVPHLADFIGSYLMLNLDVVCLDVTLDPKGSARLQMMVNKQPDQVWGLSHYHFDVFSQLPSSYDDCLSRGLDRTLWSSFLISFSRNHNGAVTGLTWKLDGVDVQFHRA
ncbi:hypothetical protein QQS21_007193 [Conoideocrella luteorostrata]|uniref:Beta-lactamase-related domain-containing protein n=1 Tax=Conoideocrella luteorostrata TaxID=1105319 RepID=A0AAJ0FXM1_9HYPO|nr:hypothetical protein QQS21_007193 [Conoideocrella luteorostrata]